MTTSVDISIIIPVLNNQKELSTCLSSIQRQEYPKDKMEILLSDGGSTDKTIEIGKRFGCKIIHNLKRLTEFGVTLGISEASGKYIIVLAADNELIGDNFIKDMIYPFIKDKRIMMTYPIQMSLTTDSWISKYINTFTDPISHFIYGNASNTRTFSKRYKTIQENDHYVIYDFSSMDYPMIALAQGTTIRNSGVTRDNPGDDILPIVDAIASQKYLAYVPSAKVVHHTISSLSIYFRKQRWAFDNYLMRSDYGLRKRTVYFSQGRKFKKFVWPLYAILVFPPLIISIIGLVKSGKKEWLYHLPLTMVSFAALVFEVVRVTILGRQTKVARKI